MVKLNCHTVPKEISIHETFLEVPGNFLKFPFVTFTVILKDVA
jgi:hypothetical protein